MAYFHQVTALPGARAETTQYDRHEVGCPCGRVHVAGAPPEAAGAPGTVTYGLNFQAWCVFLMVMHHVPVERCADIIESMSGTRPSDGWVHHLLGRAARAVAAANKASRALIILARVICGDETPLRAGPGPKSRNKKYLQVACTGPITCYFLGGRDLASFKGFVYSDLHGAAVAHDRYQNYGSFPGISHQLCCRHLLRDLEDAAGSYPGAIWPGQIADALRGLIHAAHLARDRGMSTVPGEMTAEHLTLFRHGVRVGLSQVRRVPGAKTRQPPARTLLALDRPGPCARRHVCHQGSSSPLRAWHGRGGNQGPSAQQVLLREPRVQVVGGVRVDRHRPPGIPVTVGRNMALPSCPQAMGLRHPYVPGRVLLPQPAEFVVGDLQVSRGHWNTVLPSFSRWQEGGSAPRVPGDTVNECPCPEKQCPWHSLRCPSIPLRLAGPGVYARRGWRKSPGTSPAAGRGIRKPHAEVAHVPREAGPAGQG